MTYSAFYLQDSQSHCASPCVYYFNNEKRMVKLVLLQVLQGCYLHQFSRNCYSQYRHNTTKRKLLTNHSHRNYTSLSYAALYNSREKEKQWNVQKCTIVYSVSITFRRCSLSNVPINWLPSIKSTCCIAFITKGSG